MSRAFPDHHTERTGLNPQPADPEAAPWAVSPLPDESEDLPPAMLAPGRDPRPVLESLRDDVVIGLDWPVIVEAAELTRLGHHRDLVELDRNYPARRADRWTEASFRVGRRQLARLRACRDLRVVQRYMAAVDDGRAEGWNPIVFGVALASFNLPYRQGLLHYAGTLLRGLAERGRPRGVSEGAWEHWMTLLEAPLPEAVQRLRPPATPTPGTAVFGER
jgi:hypothetical protein